MPLGDCNRCQKLFPVDARVEMGCGWLPARAEPPPDGVWSPAAAGPKATTCAGYTTALPDVLDIATAHLHWDRGELGSALGELRPSVTLRDGIELFRASTNAVQRVKRDKMRAARGGG